MIPLTLLMRSSLGVCVGRAALCPTYGIVRQYSCAVVLPEEFLFQFLHGLLVVGLAAEDLVDDLDGGSDPVEGLELEDLRGFQAGDAFVGVFVEQGFEHGVGLVAVLGEVVTLLDLVGALAPGERGLAEGDVGDEIEVAVVPPDLGGEIVQHDALLFQLVEDGLFFPFAVPALQEVVQRGVFGADPIAGEVLVGLGDELAVGADVFDTLVDDPSIYAADAELVGPLLLLNANGLILFPWLRIGRHRTIPATGLVDHRRLAVEIRVAEQLGGLLEVHDGEEPFVVLLVDAGAPADDLLEAGHGVDTLVQHDELAGLGIHSGGEQFGGGGDDGKGTFRVNEVVQLGLALRAVAGDTHHVLGIVDGELAGGVGDGDAHALGMVDVFAKDNGLGIGIGGL